MSNEKCAGDEGICNAVVMQSVQARFRQRSRGARNAQDGHQNLQRAVSRGGESMKGHGAAHLQQGGAKTEARQHLARRLALRVERAAGGIRAVRNVAGNSEVGGNTVYAARRCCGYY